MFVYSRELNVRGSGGDGCHEGNGEDLELHLEGLGFWVLVWVVVGIELIENDEM